jgi:hypothetical protein
MKDPNVPLEFIDLFRCDDGEVSQACPTVSGEISTVAEPADLPIEAIIKAHLCGLDEPLVADTDPAWSAPLEPLEKRAEVIKKFVDGEERRYIEVDGKLVEQGIEKLFSF